MPSTHYHWPKPFKTISATTYQVDKKRKWWGSVIFLSVSVRNKKSKDILKGAALKHLATRERNVGEKKAALYTLS